MTYKAKPKHEAKPKQKAMPKQQTTLKHKPNPTAAQPRLPHKRLVAALMMPE